MVAMLFGSLSATETLHSRIRLTKTPHPHQPPTSRPALTKTQPQPQHLNQFSPFVLRRAVRGSARVQPPHGHSPGPVSTRPNSKPPTPRHRPHKPSPSNLQGVPCAAVHGFNLPTVTRPAQSAPAPGQNPQAPVTHTTSWSPARTRTRALPRTARLKQNPESFSLLPVILLFSVSTSGPGAPAPGSPRQNPIVSWQAPIARRGVSASHAVP